LGLKPPQKKAVAVPVPKAVKIDNKIEAKHVVIISALLLVLVISIYIFVQVSC